MTTTAETELKAAAPLHLSGKDHPTSNSDRVERLSPDLATRLACVDFPSPGEDKTESKSRRVGKGA